MGTRKSVDQILDKAADILEVSGWVTGDCYDSETGGYCALGAIAKAVYPRAPNSRLDQLAYVNAGSEGPVDPRHLAAVTALALQIKRRKSLDHPNDADLIVYAYNDSETGKTVTFESAQKVINALRKAAEKYRASAA